MQSPIAASRLQLSLLTLLLASTGLATPAFAQDDATSSAATDSGTVEEVVVTGSRAALTGFAAPTPTTVVGAATIERQAATRVADVLAQNASFKATRSPGANTTNTSAPAMATADLRALGGQRTLVLVNGSRVVPEAPASNLGTPTAVDLNLIPTQMIDRVEIVTGGASAQYGSDAVAGVVNILLKRRMDGLEVKLQGGVSERGHNKSFRAGFVGGTNFADDRGHVVLSGDYEHNWGVGDIYTRDWGRREYQVYSNPAAATNGLPAVIISPRVRSNLGSGGRISGPAGFLYNNYTFNPGGQTIRPYDSGALANGSLQIGGEGESQATGVDLVPDVERFTTYGLMEYEVSDKLSAYIEGGYAESSGDLVAIKQRFTNVPIQVDNAFLPAVVRNQMIAQGISTITFSRQAVEIPNTRVLVTNKTPRVRVGAKGSFGDGWNWDAHYAYGRNKFRGRAYDNPITARVNFALDAVTNAAGQVVCRGVRDGVAAAAGCVPLNLFGVGSPSAAALDYINANPSDQAALYTQNSAAANLRGSPFSTWAGPISAAAGVEYRREYERVTADARGATNQYTSTGNAVPYTGKFTVKEGYLEALVPLARDMPGFKSLDLNAAVRYADYSTVGSQTTWKVGGVWEPLDGLRFRVTRSRDIRAPAINELFSPGSVFSNNIVLRGQTYFIPQNSSAGNPDLRPEKANTLTAGVVIEPRGVLSGLRLSADYYDIKINDAITALSAANIAQLCTLGNQDVCSLFTFNAAGAPTALNAGTLNLASFQNQGVDLAASYTTSLGEGRLTTTFSGTYVTHAYVNLGAGAGRIDRAGENTAANLGAIPRFRGNLSSTYSTDAYSLTAQVLYISKGKQDVTYGTTPALSVNDNHVPKVIYVNLYGSLKLTDKIEAFGAINNLFDKDPPATPYVILAAAVNGQYYDKIGRTFQLGVTFRY